MNVDTKLMFEGFVQSRLAAIQEKKKHNSRSTDPKADIDGDGKKGNPSDRYLANLHMKVMQATQKKKEAEEAEIKMRGDRATTAAHKLLADLTGTFSTQECEEILRKALDTHVTAKNGHSLENAEVAALPVAMPASV